MRWRIVIEGGVALRFAPGRTTIPAAAPGVNSARPIGKIRLLGIYTFVKVTVLHEGSVLSEGSIDHVREDPRVVEVYLGR